MSALLNNPVLAASMMALVTFAGQTARADEVQHVSNVMDSILPGEYAVGSKMVFAKNPNQRFDPWNTVYASQPYRDMLREVEASGQPRTVIAHIWYPASPKPGAELAQGQLRPIEAATGRQATNRDYFFDDPKLLDHFADQASYGIEGLQNSDGVTLGALAAQGQTEVFEQAKEDFVNRKRAAWVDAEIADGEFPLIILSHGLGDHYVLWDRLGEFLASHGYIVAAPSFISDGGMPYVFHDPSSPFANQASEHQIDAAYDLILNEGKVVPNFFTLMFDYELTGPDSIDGFSPQPGMAEAGAGEKTTTMMRNLFRQRVSDVGTLIDNLTSLGQTADICQDQLRDHGSIAQECGFFDGHLDGSRIGLSGHSLGSMTSQLGVEQLPGIATAIGFNNGAPYKWTPEEVYGWGETEDGKPIGNRKPVLQLIGSEDAFVQWVFSSLFQDWWPQAGGDLNEVFPLEDEQVLPSRDNPMPVARSAYNRSVGDKMLVNVHDVNHSTLTREPQLIFPRYKLESGEAEFGASLQAERKPLGDDVFNPDYQPETFELLDWVEVDGFGPVYVPEAVQRFYARHWFDLYVNGNEEARALITSNPFPSVTDVLYDFPAQ